MALACGEFYLASPSRSASALLAGIILAAHRAGEGLGLHQRHHTLRPKPPVRLIVPVETFDARPFANRTS